MAAQRDTAVIDRVVVRINEIKAVVVVVFHIFHKTSSMTNADQSDFQATWKQ